MIKLDENVKKELAKNQMLRKIIGEVNDAIDHDFRYEEVAHSIAFCIWLSMESTVKLIVDKKIGNNILVSITPGIKEHWSDEYGGWRCLYLLTADKEYENFYTQKFIFPAAAGNIKRSANAFLPPKYAHYVSLNQHIPKEINLEMTCRSYANREYGGYTKVEELFSGYIDKQVLPEHFDLLLGKCMIFDVDYQYSTFKRKEILDEIKFWYYRDDCSCPKKKVHCSCNCKDEFCYSRKFSCPIEAALLEYRNKVLEVGFYGTGFYNPIYIDDIAASCSSEFEIDAYIKKKYMSDKKRLLEEEKKKREKERNRKAAAERREREKKKSKEEKQKEYEERCLNPYIGPRGTNFAETDDFDDTIYAHFKFKHNIPNDVIIQYIESHDYMIKEITDIIKSHKRKYKRAYEIIGACTVSGIEYVSGEYGTAIISLKRKEPTVTLYSDDLAHELAEQYALTGKEEKDDLLIDGPVERMMDNYLDSQFL